MHYGHIPPKKFKTPPPLRLTSVFELSQDVAHDDKTKGQSKGCRKRHHCNAHLQGGDRLLPTNLSGLFGRITQPDFRHQKNCGRGTTFDLQNNPGA